MNNVKCRICKKRMKEHTKKDVLYCIHKLQNNHNNLVDVYNSTEDKK